MGELSPWHLAIFVAILLLLFGSRKLPDAARSLGQSMRIFKAETKGLREDSAAATPRPLATGETVVTTAQTVTPPAVGIPTVTTPTVATEPAGGAADVTVDGQPLPPGPGSPETR